MPGREAHSLVLAAPAQRGPEVVPAKATCGWFWRYLLTPKGSYTPRNRRGSGSRTVKKRRQPLRSAPHDDKRSAKKIWHCARLALSLAAPYTGGGSANCKQVCICARLALSLSSSYERSENNDMRPAARSGRRLQPDPGSGGGSGGRRGASQHALRHQCRRLPHRDRGGRKRRNAGENTQRIRRVGPRGRPAGQSLEGGVPSAQYPRRAQVHGLYPRGFALRTPSRLPRL